MRTVRVSVDNGGVWFEGESLPNEFRAFCNCFVPGCGFIARDRVRLMAAVDWLRDQGVEWGTGGLVRDWLGGRPPLDAVVKATTAFDTWDELAAAMDGGYVPTVYPITRRKRQLVRVIRHFGYRVWTGAQKAAEGRAG